jgi:glutamate carboxypeptidase
VPNSREAILNWLDQQQDGMIDLLRRIVNIDSSSYNKAGVDAVGAVLREHLTTSGIACEIIPHSTFGDCMRAVLSGTGAQSNRPVVLMGHQDTVFPDGTAAERPFRVEGDLAYGPGVADMKAGLVINTFVLEAFAAAGYAPVPLVGLYTSDEEIASPSSRPVIEAEARGARAVLNAEPGRPSGNVVTGRKGAAFLEVEISGKAAHSGVNHREGVSAIEALCRKVPRLHALTDYESGTTVNVGLIRAGSSVNTVAAHASAEIDIRFATIEAMEAVREQVDAILQETDVPGTTTRILAERRFLPLTQSPESKALFEAYKQSAHELGFDVKGEFTGGSADSGFTAALGAPTLCATGPVGGKPHTAEEYLDLSTLVPRAKAVALTVMRLGTA